MTYGAVLAEDWAECLTDTDRSSGEGPLCNAFCLTYIHCASYDMCYCCSSNLSFSFFFLIAAARRLCRAVSTNDVERVAALLANGANPNCTDCQQRSVLHLAACRGYCDIVRFVTVSPSVSMLLCCVGMNGESKELTNVWY